MQAVRGFKPDVVLNELTDLPDDAARINELADLNARIRTEGTQNLIEANAERVAENSGSKALPGNYLDGPDGQAVAGLERSVLAESGVVLRYGQTCWPALLLFLRFSTIFKDATSKTGQNQGCHQEEKQAGRSAPRRRASSDTTGPFCS
jgi:hypothetical protein